MRFTLALELDGVRRRFGLLAKSAADLTPALRTFDRYYRARVAQRFASEGPGWPPRTGATVARAGSATAPAGRAAQEVRRKLSRAYASAQKRHGAGKLSEDRVASAHAALVELKRQRQGGTLGQQQGAAARLEQRVGRMREQAAGRAAGGRTLGKIAGSIASSIKAGTLTVESKAPWAGAHNDGATVGHGAKLPARPFLFLDDTDREMFAEILRNHMLVEWER